ncbi:MAG: hypothetical protein KAR76_02630 [Methanosarcinales archaeon]|nr:hypothetical protein [Methanosarcinales archaeon]
MKCAFFIDYGRQIDTIIREVRGIVEGLNHFSLHKGTIITSDLFHEETVDGKAIRYVPLWYWLLENETDSSH